MIALRIADTLQLECMCLNHRTLNTIAQRSYIVQSGHRHTCEVVWAHDIRDQHSRFKTAADTTHSDMLLCNPMYLSYILPRHSNSAR